MNMLNLLRLCLLPLAVVFMQCAATRDLRMSENNAETIRIWFGEGWNKHRNLELIERCFSAEWTDGNPLRYDQIDGHEGIRQMVAFYEQSFADTHFKITHVFADKKYAAVRYEVTGKHVGEAFGVPGSGRLFSATGINVYEMEKGKIVRTWPELDLMAIIRQISQQ